MGFIISNWQFCAAKLAGKKAKYASSTVFWKINEPYSRNKELCQKVCQHILSKPTCKETKKKLDIYGQLRLAVNILPEGKISQASYFKSNLKKHDLQSMNIKNNFLRKFGHIDTRSKHINVPAPLIMSLSKPLGITPSYKSMTS